MLTNANAVTAAQPIRIVLADGHPVTLDGLEQLFRGEEFAVLARCTDGEDTVRTVRTHRPDILVLDFRLARKDGLAVIRELKRVSTPGLRKYVGVTEIPRVRNGLGMAILSTSKGLMSDRQARQARTGGEILALVW